MDIEYLKKALKNEDTDCGQGYIGVKRDDLRQLLELAEQASLIKQSDLPYTVEAGKKYIIEVEGIGPQTENLIPLSEKDISDVMDSLAIDKFAFWNECDKKITYVLPVLKKALSKYGYSPLVPLNIPRLEKRLIDKMMLGMQMKSEDVTQIIATLDELLQGIGTKQVDIKKVTEEINNRLFGDVRPDSDTDNSNKKDIETILTKCFIG